MRITSPFSKVDIDAAYEHKETDELRKLLIETFERYDNDESEDITVNALRVLKDALEHVFREMTGQSPLFNEKPRKIPKRPF